MNNDFPLLNIDNNLSYARFRFNLFITGLKPAAFKKNKSNSRIGRCIKVEDYDTWQRGSVTQEIVQVSIEIGSGYDLISINQWLGLPIADRMQLVRDNKAYFINKEGEVVPTMDAVKILYGLAQQ